MQRLTPEGQRMASDLAQRYGFSPDAVTHMIVAVLNGNGAMAQFNHPEFAGSGQWMLGGMIMLGDMFNHGLKDRVNALCHEIAGLLAKQPGVLRSGSVQAQRQSGGGQPRQASGAPVRDGPFFVPDHPDRWYPAELGTPTATGAQNNLRYAYFAHARRLAVDTGGDVWIYDTLDHQIGGFSQQQPTGGSMTFTSQYGAVNLTSLPVVSRHGPPAPPTPPGAAPPPATRPAAATPPETGIGILEQIARLGELKAQGILTEEEFTAKKAELLARL